MDFNSLLSIAQDNNKHYKPSGYRSELSAPKREKHNKPKSEVVQKLIDEKRKEKELEERKKRDHEMRKKWREEERQKLEEKNKRFVIPKKKETLENVLKDLESDSEENCEDVSDSGMKKESSKKAKDSHNKYHESERREHNHKHDSHKTSKHKTDDSEHKSEKHKHYSNHSSGNRSKSDKDRRGKVKSETQEHNDKDTVSKSRDNGGPSHSSHKSHLNSSSKHTSSNRDSKDHEKHSASSSKLSSSTASSSSNSKHSTSSDKHSSNKHSSSSSSYNSSGKSSSGSSSSSHRDKTGKKASVASGKKSAKDLSLDELRQQVKEMKEYEAQMVKEEEKDKNVEFQKNRKGVDLDEVEVKKAKILSRTQMILERTKARLAEERMGQKQKKQREGGKRTSDKGALSSKEADKIKSKSVVKDDDSSDEEPSKSLDLSSNELLMHTESGNILKNIKKKIDEQLGNYNFPEKDSKERKIRKSSKHEKKDVHTSKHDRIKDKHRGIDKRDKIKEMMRKDYQDNFSGGEIKQKVKKPAIVRRYQQQPPSLSFNDLLKIAEKKCQEKVPEPVFKVPKKVEERPLTQQEIDRKKNAEKNKQKRKEEELMYKNRPEQVEKTGSSNKSAMKSKSDSNLLRNALTGKSDRNSPAVKPNQSSSGSKSFNEKDKKVKKYDVENDNVLVCRPSSTAGSSKTQHVQESTNPFDRIYNQIKKNNPKPEKRKRAILDSSDEEYDEYDQDDDFIDDGDDGALDVSAEIRNLFGYDKRKYRDEDDDVDNMEANFATIMKEEVRSAKIGKMEDLEDIRREEEELKMKMAKKKKKY